MKDVATRIKQFNDAFSSGTHVRWYDDDGDLHWSITVGLAHELCESPVVFLRGVGNYLLDRVVPI